MSSSSTLFCSQHDHGSADSCSNNRWWRVGGTCGGQSFVVFCIQIYICEEMWTYEK